MRVITLQLTLDKPVQFPENVYEFSGKHQGDGWFCKKIGSRNDRISNWECEQDEVFFHPARYEGDEFFNPTEEFCLTRLVECITKTIAEDAVRIEFYVVKGMPNTVKVKVFVLSYEEIRFPSSWLRNKVNTINGRLP